MVYPTLLPLMRTPRLPVVDWTDAPADLNWLVRSAERRNLVSARVTSLFWPRVVGLLSCLCLCTVNLALCHAPVGLLALKLGAQDKVQTHSIHCLYLPCNPVEDVHFCCKLHVVTFAVGARAASLHSSTTIKRIGILLLWAFDHNVEVRHPRCIGSITKNFVYYTYSRTQLYFT